MADMQGYTSNSELQSLYFRLKVLKDEKLLNSPFCLFVVGKGFLNGKEALDYLETKLNKQS